MWSGVDLKVAAVNIASTLHPRHLAMHRRCCRCRQGLQSSGDIQRHGILVTVRTETRGLAPVPQGWLQDKNMNQITSSSQTSSDAHLSASYRRKHSPNLPVEPVAKSFSTLTRWLGVPSPLEASFSRCSPPRSCMSAPTSKGVDTHRKTPLHTEGARK